MQPCDVVTLHDYLHEQGMTNTPDAPATVWGRAIGDLLSRMAFESRMRTMPHIGEIKVELPGRLGRQRLQCVAGHDCEFACEPEGALPPSCLASVRTDRDRMLFTEGWFVEGKVELSDAKSLWGVVQPARLATLRMDLADGCLRSLRLRLLDLAALVRDEAIGVSYADVWDGLSGFFDCVVTGRRAALAEAEAQRKTIDRERALLEKIDAKRA